MGDAGDASLLILNAAKDAPNDDWTNYLKDVGCTLSTGTSASANGPKPLICKFANAGLLDKLLFQTPASSNTSYDVDASIRIPLVSGDGITQPATTIGDILTTFGILEKLDDDLPDDGGQPAGSTDGPKRTSLFREIVNAIRTVDDSKPQRAIVVDVSDKNDRNAIWMTPGQRLRLDTALTFKLDDIPDGIVSAIKTFGVSVNTIKTVKIIVQKTTYGLPVATSDPTTTTNPTIEWQIYSTYNFTFQIPTDSYLFWISFRPNGMTFTITQNPAASDFEGLLSLMGSSKSEPQSSSILNDVVPLRLVAGMDADNKLFWRATFALTWSEMEIYLDYDSLSQVFSGGLILDGFYAPKDVTLSPLFDPSQALIAPANHKSRPYWDIRDLSDELNTIPAVLPTAIAFARVAYQKSTKIVRLSAKLISPLPPLDNSVPQPFTWDEVDVAVSIGNGNFACAMGSHFTLRSPSTLEEADLGLMVSYSKNAGWILNGYVENLSGSMLVDFFDKEYKDALAAVLGKIKIPALQVMYTYAKGPLQGGATGKETGGDATSFAFFGLVQIGELTLRLMYQYASSKAETVAATMKSPSGQPMLPEKTTVQPLIVQKTAQGEAQTDWSFECDLGASAPDGKVATVYSVLNSIVDDVADFLPPFVQDIAIPSAEQGSPVVIKVRKSAAGQILFAFRIVIGAFSFTFAQISTKDTVDPTKTVTKKVLRFAVDKIPLIDKVPLIGSLAQPFDQLEYVWVNDVGDANLKGILDAEVDAMNASILADAGALYYRQLTGAPASAPATKTGGKVVIVPGHHFMVIRDGNAILDHVFAASTAAKQTNLANQPTPPPPPSPPPPVASPPSKGALEPKDGPLKISGVALQFKERGDKKSISITMDATFEMGPMSFSLLGFGFAIPLDSIKLNDLSSIFDKMTPEIRGMALAFNKPPVLIAGGFEHRVTDLGEHIYLGGIGIGFVPYTFVGVGEYAVMNGYKSVFLYAKLDGKLVSLAFATISGVRLGFGFNSSVRSPKIEEIFDFPFINDKSSEGAGNDPMAIVKKMVDPPASWVTPTPDAYWFAAGLTVQAFDVLTVTAVVMLAFKDSNVILSIYADAIAQMPPDVPDKNMCLVYVELGMIAEINFGEGYFRVEAALAPTSFLLVPQCHLYGGFALVYWFGSNPHAGDWVFSVGGYHPKYEKPDWYPAPGRLGISFSVGDCLSITGEAYFAVTPKCVMGGALIHVSLDIGIVKAWLDASFDCLINFHPLHYRADFHVSVGVECDIDILFIHVHISVSVGAWLTIQGPEFGGIAHVDFYLFGFDVDFGASPSPGPALDLRQFWEMLHAPGPSVDSTNKPDPKRLQSFITFDTHYGATDRTGLAAPEGVQLEGAALKFALEDGNFPSPPSSQPKTDAATTAPPPGDPQSTGAGVKWHVKGGTLRFRISTDFAVSSVSVIASTTAPKDGIQLPKDKPTNTNIYSRPMRVSDPITSELSVTVTLESTKETVGGWTKPQLDIKPIPVATFGRYSRETDPSLSDASSLLSHQDATVPLAMGIILSAPPPHLAESYIPVLKASDAAKLGVRDFRFVIPLANITAETSDQDRKEANEGLDWYVPRYEGPIVDGTKGNVVVMAPVQDLYVPADAGDGVLKESSQQRWDRVGEEWEKFAEANDALLTEDTEDSKGLLALCASVLGWDQGAAMALPAATGGKEPWRLSGKFPSKTVKGKNKKGDVVKHLEETYLWLPQIAVV